ncbi:MAG: hypothetical protein ACRD19_07655, partial [Terriglobia bacterium]
SVPVDYVGVVQAALCVKLGTNSIIANLPASAYLLGAVAPILISRVVPPRRERAALVWANIITAASMAMVWATLLAPVADSTRIVVLISQALIGGFTNSVSQVYMFQCLGRGTTTPGRAKALKLGFTWSPIVAVGGSLGAQFVLDHGIPFLTFPSDFALLYFIGMACAAGVAFTTSRFQVVPIKERQETRSLARYVFESAKSYFSVRPLAMLWIAYVLWYSVLMAMPNLSLFTQQAVGREPAELSGLIMAIRFGGKSLGGLALGVIALRRGIRAPVAGCVLLLGLGIIWAWAVPGYAFLIAFALMGAGELGGAYFPNYVVTVSLPETGARDLSILTLAMPVAALSPILYGSLSQLYGYPASFAVGILIALLALALVLKLPAAAPGPTPAPMR